MRGEKTGPGAERGETEEKGGPAMGAELRREGKGVLNAVEGEADRGVDLVGGEEKAQLGGGEGRKRGGGMQERACRGRGDELGVREKGGQVRWADANALATPIPRNAAMRIARRTGKPSSMREFH